MLMYWGLIIALNVRFIPNHLGHLLNPKFLKKSVLHNFYDFPTDIYCQ